MLIPADWKIEGMDLWTFRGCCFNEFCWKIFDVGFGAFYLFICDILKGYIIIIKLLSHNQQLDPIGIPILTVIRNLISMFV